MLHPPTETTAQTLNNPYYRHVVELNKHHAFVLMSIPYGGSIPMEIHDKAVQFTRVEHGTCTVTVDGVKYKVPEEGHFFIDPKQEHEVVNDDCDGRTLKLYSSYVPPPPDFYEGLIHRTQMDAK